MPHRELQNHGSNYEQDSTICREDNFFLWCTCTLWTESHTRVKTLPHTSGVVGKKYLQLHYLFTGPIFRTPGIGMKSWYSTKTRCWCRTVVRAEDISEFIINFLVIIFAHIIYWFCFVSYRTRWNLQKRFMIIVYVLQFVGFVIKHHIPVAYAVKNFFKKDFRVWKLNSYEYKLELTGLILSRGEKIQDNSRIFSNTGLPPPVWSLWLLN